MSLPASGERMALNADEFAARWCVSPEYIQELRKAGKLPYLRDGHGLAFPVAAADRAMLRRVLTAKTDADYQRNRALGKSAAKRFNR